MCKTVFLVGLLLHSMQVRGHDQVSVQFYALTQLVDHIAVEVERVDVQPGTHALNQQYRSEVYQMKIVNVQKYFLPSMFRQESKAHAMIISPVEHVSATFG